MRWRVPISCALAVGISLAPARATLQSDYLEIYLKLNDSERLERNGDFRDALAGFEDCYARLHKIHVNNPDWERVLVTSRMEDCRAKIVELEPKVGESVPPPSTVVPAPGTGTTTPPMPESTPAPLPAGASTSALQTRLQEVEQELAETKKELAETQAKYQSSQSEVLTLHAQLDSVNEQLAALKSSESVDERMGTLMARNKELTDKLIAAQTEIRTLTHNPKSGAAKLAAQLQAVQEKLAASEAANAGLTETTGTLQQQLNKAQNDLAVANSQLAATGPGSPAYLALKHENEVMRGILTREIQEQSRRDGAKRLAQEEFDRLKINSRVLQEQLDILGSPMTPPGNDDERNLLSSLKTAPAEVAPLADNGDNSGNHFAVSTTGAPVPDTNTAPATPPPAPETNAAPENAAPPTSAAPPAAATDTNVAPSSAAGAAAAAAAAASASTNTAAALAASAGTNTPPTSAGTPPAPGLTDNGAAPSSTSTNGVTSAAVPDTNAAPPPAGASVTAATVPTNAAPAAATNASPAPATNAPPSPETNPAAATDTHAAPATNAAPTEADTNRYSNKPRLPEDMRKVAQDATELFQQKQYDAAADKYQTIIDKYPESLYAWSNLGVVRSQQGKLPEAMKALQQAVKLSPNDAFSYRNLGIGYYQLGQNDAAIDALERSIALDPNNVYSHDYLGCACSQKGWEEVAEKEFRKAIEINPDFPDAQYNLAIVYAMQKPPALELARRHYRLALKLGLPKDMRLEKLLGL